MATESLPRRTPRPVEEPFIGPGNTLTTISERLSTIVLTSKTPGWWWLAAGLAFLGCLLLLWTLFTLVTVGVGIWGVNQPVAWGFDIINFVWWIGIGHAGTLISAILLLLRQDWRTSINRFAEAMTIFAVMCAGLFPIFHMGRPWLAYWFLPYPGSLAMYPQFKSPLEWDVFAISTYFTVSLLFWLTGLIPDFAMLRDRAKNKLVKMAYGIASLGWRGSQRHWARFEVASLLLAGISTPLVVSVHSIVSLDFAVSQVPGWNVTVFPPYFVAGAVFSGFAMVLTLMIPIRRAYGIEDYITMRHIDLMAKVMLTTGLVVFYGYICEAFYSWYSGIEPEMYMILNRMTGPYWWSYWALILCNGILPQLLWIKRFRMNLPLLWVLTIIINIGMWLERYVIIVTSLHRDYIPSSWGMYWPTIWDWAMYLGTFGLFFFGMMFFIRFLPMIAVFEMLALQHKQDQEAAEVVGHGHAH